jgi:hypothetical protein
MTSIQIYSNSDEVAQLFVLLFNIVPIRVHQKKFRIRFVFVMYRQLVQRKCLCVRYKLHRMRTLTNKMKDPQQLHPT